MPIIKTCELCGKEFSVPPSDSKQRFCGAECGNKSRRVVTKYTCETCGTPFEKRGKRDERVKYCSPGCRNKGMQKRTTRKCAVCGKDVTRAESLNQAENVFCSLQCAGVYRAENIRGENHPRYNSITRDCAICGKEIQIPFSVDIYKNVRTCSRECRAEYEKRHPRKYKANEQRQYLAEQKKIALERDNYTCQHCGAKEDLELHHIKKRRSFKGDLMAADNADNLITYCHTCHLTLEPRKRITESEYRANLSDSARLKGSVERRE